MEILGVVDVPLWILFLIAFIVLLYRYGTATHSVWKDLNVKGPPPSAFFGNVQEFFDDKKGPRKMVLKWQQEYGQTFAMYFFRKPVLVVTDLEILKEVFVKDFANFEDRFFVGDGKLQHRVIKKGVFFEFGQDWKRIRKIMTPTFSTGKLKLMLHSMNRNAGLLGDNLVNYAQDDVHADAKTVFGAYALDVIAGTAFGLEMNSQQDYENIFIKEAKELMTFGNLVKLRMAIAAIFPQVIPILRFLNFGFFKWKPVKFYRDHITHWVNERKRSTIAQRETDFLQLLVNAEADPNDDVVGSKMLSEEEVVAQGVLFIIAGYETTSTTLQYLMYELGHNHHVQDRLVAEIEEVIGDCKEPTHEHCQNLKYVEAVINETLRMYPPVHILTRTANEATTIKGIPIPAGAGILIPIYNIGRDPKNFEDPDTFNPDRFMDDGNQLSHGISFLPFGYGPRQCMGLRLAVMEMKLAISQIMKKVIIHDSTPKVLDIEDYAGTLVPKEPIKLILKERN